MPKNWRFWSNVALIAAAHAAVIFGLIRWSSAGKDASTQSVIWMNGGGGDGVVLANKTSPAPRKESKKDAGRLPEVDNDRAFLASAPSEIQLPAKPTPTPTPAPVHAPKLKPKETPKPKAT